MTSNLLIIGTMFLMFLILANKDENQIDKINELSIVQEKTLVILKKVIERGINE